MCIIEGMLLKKKEIYLDYAGSTPVRKEVQSVYNKMQKEYANPSAIYKSGVRAREHIEKARMSIARHIEVQPEEVLFFATGTEVNNTMLQGVVFSSTEEVPHVVTTTIEHPSILEVCRSLEREGKATVTYIEPDSDGVVSPEEVKKALRMQTVLVTVMYVNNEIGTIQPIASIARAVMSFKKEHGLKNLFVHTDASQAVCYEKIHIQALGVDMVTFDSIKMYGPRGCAVLVKRKNVLLAPLMYGGGQERGLRPGTENVPAIVSCAHAFTLAEREKERERLRVKKLQEYLIKEITERFPEASINGSCERRIVNNVNVCFPRIDAEFAVIYLAEKGIACSYASACRTQKETASSYVLEAIGHTDCALSSLRVTLGKYTKKSDINYFLKHLTAFIHKYV